MSSWWRHLLLDEERIVVVEPRSAPFARGFGRGQVQRRALLKIQTDFDRIMTLGDQIGAYQVVAVVSCVMETGPAVFGVDVFQQVWKPAHQS